jgi:hypothetical protein
MSDAPARSEWPIRTFALGAEPTDDLRPTTTAEERLRMLADLSAESWTLSGLPEPDYTRDRSPVRVRPLRG